mgnify:FL=1
MRKNLLLLLVTVFVLGAPVLRAQEDEAKSAAQAAISTKVKSNDIKDSVKFWKFSGIVGLNASQTQLWNWAAGGNNNVTGVVYANMTLSYKKNKLAWDTNLDTELGELYSADLNPRWRKSNDKLNLYSKLGYELAKQWYLSVLGSFRTQYLPGFEYANNDAGDMTLISRWASPSYTDLSIGVDWRPNDIFNIYVSPVAGRLTYCRDSTLRDRYGIPEKTRDDGTLYRPAAHAALGLVIKGGVNYDKIKNFKVISTVTLFTPYTSKVQKFGNFDVDWDLAVSYTFFKVLSVSLMTSLKYYDQVMISKPDWDGVYGSEGHPCPRVQFKEMLGLGIGYSF